MLELEWNFGKTEWSCAELERYIVELELELEWNFGKMEWSCVELELYIAELPISASNRQTICC
jgi:hypothetical protein